jgi:hypothetical protein
MDLKVSPRITESLLMRMRLGLWPSEVMAKRMSAHADRGGVRFMFEEDCDDGGGIIANVAENVAISEEIGRGGRSPNVECEGGKRVRRVESRVERRLLSTTVFLAVALSGQHDIGGSLKKPETPGMPKVSSLKRPAPRWRPRRR